MADKTRQYPDISFVDTNTESLVNNLIQAFELFHEKTTGQKRKLYPADPVRIFILWIADIIMQERVIIDTAAKQNVPRYAEGEYLDSLAEIFKDAERLQPQSARVTLRFYLSAPQPSAQVIPAGTRATVDGEITFETTENLTVNPGTLFGDVTAVCQTPGAAGNGFLPGQITQIVDLYPFYDHVENITMSEGGADTETDSAFHDRMRESMETFSTAGPAGAYIYHAKTASQKIADVMPLSPLPGVVDVRVLLENGELPDSEILQIVREALSDDTVRPLTDLVIVSPPDTLPFNIEVKYFISKPRASAATTIIKDAENAVERYIKWQTQKMGRDINPSHLIAELMTVGVKRVEVISPAYTEVERGAVAVPVNKSVIYGGVEDE